MDMNILKYMAFIRTVEYGSFTKDDQMLKYSQSEISRMINDLEKEWKVVLLERSRAGVRLTSDGMKLLPYARSLCNEYQKLQVQVDELNGLQSGLIRIGTFSSVATHWLPNIIREFQKDYPNIDYELLLGDYTEIEEWISDGRVDCGFLRLPTHPDFETTFLEQDKLLVILPENHPLADCERFPVAELCNDPFMLLEKGAKAEGSEIFERCGLTPKVHLSHGTICNYVYVVSDWYYFLRSNLKLSHTHCRKGLVSTILNIGLALGYKTASLESSDFWITYIQVKPFGNYIHRL
jgi:DNA-binding transcriptional LysR family regulator